MEINDTAILQEILSLSKESAAADAKMSQELTSVRDDIAQMKSRMDKQDIILEHLAIQMNEQKRLTEEVAGLKELVKSQQEQIEELKLKPAKKMLEAKEKISDKFFDSFANMVVSALTSAIIVFFAQLFMRG